MTREFIFDSFIPSISKLGKASKLLLGYNNTEEFLSKTALYKQAIFNRDSTALQAAVHFDNEEELKYRSDIFASLPLQGTLLMPLISYRRKSKSSDILGEE